MDTLKFACLEQAIILHSEIGDSTPNTVLDTAKAFYKFCTEEKENTLTVERTNRNDMDDTIPF